MSSNIVLHQFPRPKQGINFSPFCVKLEAWLRLSKIPFEHAAKFDIRAAPKGKMPFIEIDGRKLGDSNLIIEHLANKFGDPLDRELTTAQRATSLAFRRMIDENLYWCLVYARWIDEAHWPAAKKALFGGLPPPLSWFVPGLVRKKIHKQMIGHGMGRHSQEEIYAIGKRDLSALADFLGDRDFAFGDAPSTLDCTMFGALLNLVYSRTDSPLVTHVRQYANLRAHTMRMWRLAFPDIAQPESH